MAQSGIRDSQGASPAHWPARTHWSLILEAANPAAPRARIALEALCQAYWYPVYAYIRRRGHPRPDAEDLTQSFFLHLFETQALAAATPGRGRFRAFLRAAADNFLVSEWRRDNALKRGGAVTFLSWDELRAEERYAQEPDRDLAPEQAFDRCWCESLLRRVLERLRRELALRGEPSLFDAIKDRLLGDAEAQPYGDLARQLGTTEAALKKSVQRLRERFGALLRREVGHTVATPREADDELRYLLVVVSA